MPISPDLNALVSQRDQLKSQLSQIGEMRPGSLVARFRKCGKPSCHCAKKGTQGHGPSYSLTRAVAGKTLTRIVPPGVAARYTGRRAKTFQSILGRLELERAYYHCPTCGHGFCPA